MRMYLLSSDEDTLTGMRLAGIDGRLIKNEQEFVETAEEIQASADIGILLVAVTLGEQYPEQVLELKKKSKILVTQIPDMLHPTVSGDSITRYVRDAIGISV
ncbi:MAG: V-type ATP synthase subunit F [Faecalibacterium sp.]|nr:V-type ATP synthase subunit F [Ruminococcus sp.]MCM1392628.1 V-type ATP synthase subunit F [Ruminococcus sp.]MCM1486065.1 V-type ATP synthase subunit F [Faecalibacterium sp.]